MQRRPRQPLAEALSIAQQVLIEEPVLANRLRTQLPQNTLAADRALSETIKYLALFS